MAQDALRCDVCEAGVVQSRCDLCEVKLCKTCVGEHLANLSQKHKVAPFQQCGYKSDYPNCQTHIHKPCHHWCKTCDIPICVLCSSDRHKGHISFDTSQVPGGRQNVAEKDAEESETYVYPNYKGIASELRNFNDKRGEIQRDLQELENIFCPHFKERFSEIREQKPILGDHYEQLTTAVSKQGDVWHSEIDVNVKKRKSDVDEMRRKHLTALDNQEEELEQIISELEEMILDMKEMLNSNNVALTSAYYSSNDKFRKLPGKLLFSFPTFTPKDIDEKFVSQNFGCLTPLSITTDHQVAVQTHQTDVALPVLLDEPRLVTTINTNLPNLHSVACVNDENVWMSGEDNIIKLYDLNRSLVKAIQTKSGNMPFDIAVTNLGDLVYSDRDLKTINIVKINTKQIQEVIRLRHWTPYNIGIASSGDLLVTMESNKKDPDSRVVRYHALAETQIIQYDSAGKPLYSANKFTVYSKYICENTNLDICVSDSRARAIVVVNGAGKLRFKYAGHHSAKKKKKFSPVGIATDSQSRILTTDVNDNRIHVLDRDGQFLLYIKDVDLVCPWGLCVDSKDNLFVVECQRSQVRMIKYLDI